MRRSIRALGPASQWYMQLRVFLLVMDQRAVMASWTYNQIWLESATDIGLDLWGVRYQIQRNAGEQDESYRERLIVERAFRDGKSDLQSKRKRLIQYLGDVDSADVKIQSVYNLPVAKESFYMGGPIDQPNYTRKYILFRYWIELPALSGGPTTRQKIVGLIAQLNIGGNIPEFRESQPDIDWMTMGGTMGETIGSRRSEHYKNILTY